MNRTTYDPVRLRTEGSPYSRYHYQQGAARGENLRAGSPLVARYQMSTSRRNPAPPYSIPSYSAASLTASPPYSDRSFATPPHPTPRHQEEGGSRKRSNPVKRQFDLWFILVAVIVFLVILALSLFFLFTEDEPKIGARSFVSTPSSEWVKGTMPTLYQKDDQWAKHPYAEADFGESGCGPISLAMVYIYLTGDTSRPPTYVADLSTAGGYASTEGTSWSFMEEGATLLGIQSEALSAEKQTILTRLEAGNPIIAIMGPGDFTTTGHFIVIYGIDENGKLKIKDSNSEERTKQAWDIDTVLSQCRGLWAYS